MDANWRPTQGSDPAAGVDSNGPAPAGGEWRAQLQPQARSRIVNKIMETLKKHLPVSVPEGLNELQKIAVRFEEKIYTAATNQSDYLRKISLKMLSMETKTQQAPGNAQVIPNQNNPGSETQGSDPNPPASAGGDWQDQFCPEARCRIVDKITTELRRHHPGSEPEALYETQLLAVQFEHEMYTVATSQADYLRKIRQKMLSIETNRQQAPGNAQVIPNQNNPGSAPGLPLQGSNQAQSSAIPLMSQQQARQPNTSTSVQASSLTNIGQNLPGVSQTSTLQNASVMPQNTNE